MRRSVRVLFSSLLFVALASAARAQGVGTIHFGLGGGADFPIEDQSDVYKTGWNGTFLIPINFGASPVSMRFDGSYHELQTKDLVAFNGTGKTRIISGTADVVIGPRGLPVEFYFLGGVGAYDLRFEGQELSTGDVFSDSSTRFGWNAGGGLAFPLGTGSGSRFFVEARYTSISVNGDRFTNSIHTGGSRFTIIPVNVGFIF
jgi:opacity protein-like surface antigen